MDSAFSRFFAKSELASACSAGEQVRRPLESCSTKAGRERHFQFHFFPNSSLRAVAAQPPSLDVRLRLKKMMVLRRSSFGPQRAREASKDQKTERPSPTHRLLPSDAVSTRTGRREHARLQSEGRGVPNRPGVSRLTRRSIRCVALPPDLRLRHNPLSTSTYLVCCQQNDYLREELTGVCRYGRLPWDIRREATN